MAIGAFLLFLLLIHAPSPGFAASAAWYDTNWQYRRAITIDNTANSNVLSQYQVKITLTSSTFDFSHALSDGSDIRVTDSDGTTVIPYWIQSYDHVGQTATIWVRVPSIPASGSKALYLYYDNPNGSSGTNPFTVPPTGLFTPGTSQVGTGLAENAVYDHVTNAYYVVTSDTFAGPIHLWTAASMSGTWSDLGSILTVGASGWDSSQVYAPHLIEDGGIWYLFYSGGPAVNDSHSIGYATASSVTGPYTKYASNPVLSYSGTATFDQYRACEPYVYFSGILSKWVMLYMGDAGAGGTQIETVGMATAPSITGPWTKGGQILGLGSSLTFDAGTVADPWAIEVNGSAYIGYTSGMAATEPWDMATAVTSDYQTFSKLGPLLSRILGGSTDMFRGAVTRVGDTYYLPYTTSVVSPAAAWRIATASALSTSQGFDPSSVLLYADGFDGTAVNPASIVGTGTVSGGILTVTNTTVQGTRPVGVGSVIEVRNQRTAVSGHAAEVGLGNSTRTNVLRMFDLIASSTSWQKNATAANVSTETNMAQTVDNNWHTMRIAWVSSSLARFQVDSNPWEDITTNIPSVLLPPWLFAFGTGQQLNVDWIVVRQYANSEPSNTVGSETTLPVITPTPTPTPAPTAPPTAASSTASSSHSSVSPSTCRQTPPGTTASWLYAAVPQDAHAILLYFTDASAPFDHYSLSYGTASGNAQFGVDRFGGAGTRTELVSALSPTTTYYFKLRAGNGCATGPWSNEIAATTLATNASGSLNPQIVNARAIPETTSPSRSGSPTPTPVSGTSGNALTRGYGVSVRVIDTQGNAIAGAAVTLHSKAQTALTDQRGVAQFNNVAKGQHELLIAYHGQTGTQSLYLTGDHVQTFQFTVKIQASSPLMTRPVIVVVSALLLIILGLLGVLYQSGVLQRVSWQKIKLH